MRFQNIYLQHRTEQQDPPDETDYVFEALLDQRVVLSESGRRKVQLEQSMGRCQNGQITTRDGKWQGTIFTAASSSGSVVIPTTSEDVALKMLSLVHQLTLHQQPLPHHHQRQHQQQRHQQQRCHHNKMVRSAVNKEVSHENCLYNQSFVWCHLVAKATTEICSSLLAEEFRLLPEIRLLQGDEQQTIHKQ
ncbi:hypothetical protein OUZ56_012950 [Daphnia magna]|uniref:Uncharacterized protein n=1 Tax=Daphnia magna TaxID=35525 RepID=A0ABQ9Z4I2_9CRUS|nr:hypothetical protein OUZ56_012950 [Daphnia magna]